jgi:FERM and PDZ domain-containing protein 4
METVVLISPRFGISQIAGMRSNTVSLHNKNRAPFFYSFFLQPMPIADIQSVRHVTVSRQDELSTTVTLHLLGSDQLCLSMEDKDSEELVLVLRGYYHLLTGVHLSVDCPPEDPTPEYDSGKKYAGCESVVAIIFFYVCPQCLLIRAST